MANQENLVSIGSRTTEEKREICTKGGKASGKRRKEKKLLKDTMQTILDMKIDETSIELIQGIVQTEFKNMDAQTALSIALVKKAMMGDVQAYNSIRDILGQKPVDKVQEVSDAQEVVVIHNVGQKKKRIY